MHAAGPKHRGQWGERVAAWLLRLKGYRILARQDRGPMGEIDIIAARGNTLVFVEVKSRPTYAQALDAVSAAQQGAHSTGRRTLRCNPSGGTEHDMALRYCRGDTAKMAAPSGRCVASVRRFTKKCWPDRQKSTHQGVRGGGKNAVILPGRRPANFKCWRKHAHMFKRSHLLALTVVTVLYRRERLGLCQLDHRWRRHRRCRGLSRTRNLRSSSRYHDRHKAACQIA